MANFIDYQRIARAIAFYTKAGYKYIEVPWSVPTWANRVTCPDPEFVFWDDDGKVLVGSAEQSFIALMGEGRLPPGKYVACTPCFRWGDDDGDLHQSMFMKVELIRTDKVDNFALSDLVGDATNFITSEIESAEIDLIATHIGFDLDLNGVEIGSYGIRGVNHAMEWVYGTGLAEPRFTMALSRP